MVPASYTFCEFTVAFTPLALKVQILCCHGIHSFVKKNSNTTLFIFPEPQSQTLPRWIYQGILIGIVLIAVVVISADFPTEDVIQVCS